MRPVLAAAALLAAIGLLWLAGESHRQNCIRDNRTSCSVLPWDRGEKHATVARPTAAEKRQLDLDQRIRDALDGGP